MGQSAYTDAPLTPQQGAFVDAPLPDYRTKNAVDAAGNPITDTTENALGLPRGLIAASPALSGAVGSLKGVAGSVYGAARLASHLIPGDHVLPPTPQALRPVGGAEQIGHGAERLAEFFLPSGALSKAKAAFATGSGILDALVGAGLEGASGGAVQSVQQGDTQGAGKTALFGAGTTLGMQAGTAASMGAVGALGRRMESALIKPTQVDVKNGFAVANVFKHDLGGTLSQTYDKAEAKLSSLGTQLQHVLSSARTPSGHVPQVDVLQALADTAADLKKNAARTFGSNTAIDAAINKLVDDPMFQTLAPQGVVDLSTANKVKQAIGDLGAWLHDPSGRVVRDPDSKGMETVANALYTKLKTAIDTQAHGALGAINKQISEILPIRQAIIRRIPIEQRANVLNMGDLLSFGTGTWGLSLANRLLKSGPAANAMVKAGAAASTAPAVGAAMGRAAMAGASTLQTPDQ